MSAQSMPYLIHMLFYSSSASKSTTVHYNKYVPLHSFLQTIQLTLLLCQFGLQKRNKLYQLSMKDKFDQQTRTRLHHVSSFSFLKVSPSQLSRYFITALYVHQAFPFLLLTVLMQQLEMRTRIISFPPPAQLFQYAQTPTAIHAPY